jgi:2-dehydropantoate 2-reductase
VLNGVRHIEVLSERLGAGRVLGGVTQFSVVRTADGEINVPGVGNPQTLFGELSGKRTPRCEAIAAALADRSGAATRLFHAKTVGSNCLNGI